MYQEGKVGLFIAWGKVVAAKPVAEGGFLQEQ